MKLSIEWNNTDWSVSIVKATTPEFQSQLQMNTENMTSLSDGRPNILHLPTLAPLRTSLSDALQYARRDAEAIAWNSGFPELVLPCLREELEVRAREYWNHQLGVQERSARLLRCSFTSLTRSEAA